MLKLYFGLLVIFALSSTVYCSGEKYLRLASLENCELPDEVKDLDNKIPLDFNVRKLGRRNVRVFANATVYKKTGPLKLNVTFKEQTGNDNVKTLDVMFNCLLGPLKLIYKELGVTMTKDCYVEKGFYQLKSFDFNRLTPMIYNILKYGRYTYRVNYTTDKGSVACFETVLEATKS